ncbi:MAG: glycerol-3-phosphate dehydrogenase/oxidase [Elusimicrobia bacterium]|nr:glycerol-3-phosphate dehydrogenase/oxidase [Elusimicrobiota bacterium]
MSPYDVLILGGGITGAGILRDCALRGLKACLIEKGDPAQGTTANSSHLIHGGLRYLLYDRLTTHATSWDSGHIVRIARPLLTRLPILWPVYSWHTHGLETIHTLMKAYSPFQKMKYGLPPLRLTCEETLRLVPGLTAENLKGGLVFDEWVINPTLLVRQNLEAASQMGAEVLTRTETEESLIQSGRLEGMRVKKESGESVEIKAKLTVNATGPWVNAVARNWGLFIPLKLRKGTHLVYDVSALRSQFSDSPVGMLLEAADQERYIFIIPAGEKILVGPTDIPCHENPDRLRPDPDEIRYLIQSTQKYLKLPEDFQNTLCGARPIIDKTGNEKLLSREYEIFDHEALEGLKGAITIAGGKMSSYRMMAEDLVDLLCRKLGKSASCTTYRKTLPGEEIRDIPQVSLPNPLLKNFLMNHPRLREIHALAYLGAGFVKHILTRTFTQEPPPPDLWQYYHDLKR